MKRTILFLVFVLVSLSQIHLTAYSEDLCCGWIKHGRHHFYIGPEVYHMKRTREGGSKQRGTLVGVRLGYERLYRCKIYWAADFLYGYGELRGKSGDENKLKSRFTDLDIEGRLGYTFEQKEGWRCSFTPYSGYGYANEKNNFVSPSPLHVHFCLHYQYVPIGFLSSMQLCPQWTLGLNGKVKILLEAKNKVSNDPEFGESSMMVRNKLHYRVEIPLTYSCGQFSGSLIPFYEFRRYGGHPNFPFDFQETKARIYGATLKLIYTL